MTAGVSVLTTVRDGAAFVPAFLANIRALEGTSLQFVVVDDHSNDATLQLLHEAAHHDDRLTIARSPRPGRGHALNAGLALCRHDYVAIQDIDDRSYSWRLAHSRAILDRHPEIALIGFKSRNAVDPAALPDEPPPPSPLGTGGLEPLDPLLRVDNPITHSTVVVRRTALLAVGGYNPALRSQFDFDLYLRLIEAGYGLYRGEGEIADRQKNPNSWFENRRHVRYRLRSALLCARALRQIDGPARDWIILPLKVLAAFMPRAITTRTSNCVRPMLERQALARLGDQVQSAPGTSPAGEVDALRDQRSASAS